MDFNFFKKKEKGFDLDAEQLPSLSQLGPSSPPGGDKAVASSPFSSQDQDFSPSSFASPDPEDFTVMGKGAAYTGPSPQNQAIPYGRDITPSGAVESARQEEIKLKLETLEGNLTLMNVRLNKIEQKIDMLYKLVSMEVSPDTRARFGIKESVTEMKQNGKFVQ